MSLDVDLLTVVAAAVNYSIYYFLEDFALLAETVVGLAAIDRLTNDDVIQKADFHDLTGVDELLGDGFVCGAGFRISRGMIVEQDKAVGLVADDGAEDIARVTDGLI